MDGPLAGLPWHAERVSYRVQVHPDPEGAGWLLVDVDGVGRTQARSVDEARSMAVDLIRAVAEDDEPELELTVEDRSRPVGA